MNEMLKYSDMYNHITIPGRDPDPSPLTTDVTAEANTPQPPPPPPIPSITYNSSLFKKLENNKLSTQNGAQTYPSTIYLQRYIKENYSASSQYLSANITPIDGL